LEILTDKGKSDACWTYTDTRKDHHCYVGNRRGILHKCHLIIQAREPIPIEEQGSRNFQHKHTLKKECHAMFVYGGHIFESDYT
jgi:hypothetical protein